MHVSDVVDLNPMCLGELLMVLNHARTLAECVETPFEFHDVRKSGSNVD
ncbi:unnamed protein product [Laminaria digitata]